MVWYSHLFQNFPQFIVIHIVKGFGIVNKTEIDAFLELSCFFDDPMDVGILISVSSAFSKTSLRIWKFMFHILLKLGWEDLEHYLLAWEMSAIVRYFDHSLALPFFGMIKSSMDGFKFYMRSCDFLAGSLGKLVRVSSISSPIHNPIFLLLNFLAHTFTWWDFALTLLRFCS